MTEPRGRADGVEAFALVAVSGGGRSVVRAELARAVYERMQRMLSAKAAATWGVDQVEPGEQVGISAINQISMHVASSVPIAWAQWSPTGVRTGAVSP